MKRVLLTGATGLIGRHCLPTLLAQGYEVHTVSTRAASTHLPGVHAHQADLLDPSQLATLLASVQPSHLLHLAWYTQPGAYWTSLENIRWVQASLGLLQAFAAHGGRRVVMAGSCAEYDWSYGYCTEHITPLQPATVYGKAKHALQLLEDAFAKQAQISAAWGRLFFLYGPHEYPDRLVAAVTRALLQGQPARCSHGNQIRDFLYVQDAADAFVALLTSDVRGAVNIGSGTPIALKQIIHSSPICWSSAALCNWGRCRPLQMSHRCSLPILIASRTRWLATGIRPGARAGANRALVERDTEQCMSKRAARSALRRRRLAFYIARWFLCTKIWSSKIAKLRLKSREATLISLYAKHAVLSSIKHLTPQNSPIITHTTIHNRTRPISMPIWMIWSNSCSMSAAYAISGLSRLGVAKDCF